MRFRVIVLGMTAVLLLIILYPPPAQVPTDWTDESVDLHVELWDSASVVANRVTTVPSNMVVHNVTSEDIGTYTGVVKAIDRILREESLVNASGIIDLPTIHNRWREIPYSEAKSFLRFFGEEITEDTNVYIVYIRFIGDIYSILIRLE